MSAFFDGLVRPSLTALTTAVLVVVFGLTTFVALARPSMMTPATLLPFDDDGWTTATVMHPPQGVRWAFIGASGTRESIDHGVFAEELGGPFLNLTAPSQTLLGTVALAEKLPSSVETVVIGISANRLSYGPKRLDRIVNQPNIGFYSSLRAEELQREFGRTEPHTGLLAVDRRVFYLYWMERLPRAAIKGFPGTRSVNRYRGKARKPPTYDVSQRYQMQTEYQAAHLRVLGRLVDRLTEQGRRVVLLASPTCLPEDNESFAAMEKLYQAGMKEFVAAHEVQFWTLDDAAGLECDHFYDSGHLRNPDAQSRYARVLAARLRGE